MYQVCLFINFCEDEVFKPLGMHNTKWFYRDVDKSLMAMPYGYSAFGNEFYPLGYYGFINYPDGQLKTSVTEFRRFLSVFLNNGKTLEGNQYLKAETVEEMLTVQYPEVSDIPALSWATWDDKHMHGGSDPGVDTMVVISTRENLGVIMFANSGGIQAWRTELGLEIRHDLMEYLELYGIPKEISQPDAT